MSATRVSIIITNYNYGRFLDRCIGSALSQSYPNVEVVVVDDASQDKSREIILGYSDRITAVLQETNRGQGAAFNSGFAVCNGDVIMFLDADDWLYPQAVATVVAAMSKGVAQVQFRLHLVDGDGRRIDLLPAREVRFDSGDVVPLLITRGRYECTVTSGNAFSRKTLESILPVPEQRFRISADGYLVTIAPLCGLVASIDQPLGAYAVHGTNNWTGGFGHVADPVRFRRALGHDQDRYDALRQKAAERGLVVVENPGLADAQYLTNRIGSLVLDPKMHPEPSDWRFALALRGAWASRNMNLPCRLRALLATWFLSIGILPRSWAARVLAWRLDPVSRPDALKWLLSATRSRVNQADRAG